MNSETPNSTSAAAVGYDAMYSILGQRIAQLTAAIHHELRQQQPDAQHVELLELQQAELHHLRDEVKPNDSRAIARHIAHFGRIVREYDDKQATAMTTISGL